MSQCPGMEALTIQVHPQQTNPDSVALTLPTTGFRGVDH